MSVGMCSTSTALGRHEAIFMSHPTTILNTCQQRKYYPKWEKSLWCTSPCRELCEFWTHYLLGRNGECLHYFSAYPNPPRPPIAWKQFCSFSSKLCHLVFSTFACYSDLFMLERAKVKDEMFAMVEYKVDLIFLNFENLLLIFFLICSERIFIAAVEGWKFMEEKQKQSKLRVSVRYS